jgi:hypothetical protein
MSGDRNAVSKETEQILKQKDLTAHVECENESDTGNSRANGTSENHSDSA